MDSRARHVEGDIKKGRQPDEAYTPAMACYHEYRRTRSCADEDALTAFRIRGDRVQREILEALLFCEAVPEEVEAAFAVPVRAQGIYAELFFDMGAFRTKLDKVSYLENYRDAFGRELKLRALNLGPEFVYYTYANIVPKSEAQRALMKRMFMASAYKAMSINFNPLNSKTAKNALAYAQVMLKAFEAIERVMGDEVTDDHDLVKVLTAKNDSLGITDTLALPAPVKPEDIV